MALPQDPFILLSYVNTKLRDDYSSLDDLCGALDVDKEDILSKLSKAGFEYDESSNRFI